MKTSSTPYRCHLFVCVNDRHGERKSCADGDGAAIKAYLKEQVEQLGWKGRVRVSHCGCLGLCAQGPNVLLHPQGVWFSSVTRQDADAILQKVREILG